MNTLFPVTRMLDAALSGHLDNWNEADGTPGRTPRADILEGEKEFRVLMDLPGVPHDNLDLSIEDQTLWVKAERSESVPEGFESRRKERAGHVTFSRTFSLGQRGQRGRHQRRVHQRRADDHSAQEREEYAKADPGEIVLIVLEGCQAGKAPTGWNHNGPGVRSRPFFCHVMAGQIPARRPL